MIIRKIIYNYFSKFDKNILFVVVFIYMFKNDGILYFFI